MPTAEEMQSEFQKNVARDIARRLEASEQSKNSEDLMLKWFAFDHLADPLREVSIWFSTLAQRIVSNVDAGPERTVALRKLLEAKDAAVRAKLYPGG